MASGLFTNYSGNGSTKGKEINYWEKEKNRESMESFQIRWTFFWFFVSHGVIFLRSPGFLIIVEGNHGYTLVNLVFRPQQH